MVSSFVSSVQLSIMNVPGYLLISLLVVSRYFSATAFFSMLELMSVLFKVINRLFLWKGNDSVTLVSLHDSLGCYL